MSKKSDLVARLVDAVTLRQPFPDAPLEGATLLEQGAVLVLMRSITQKQAEATVHALREAYGDWNEVRVSQVQEIAQHVKTASRKKGTELLRELSGAATLLRVYLQDVFQETHGLDLEFLREDVSAGGKTITDLSSLGMAGGAYLLWLAGDREVPVHIGLVRLLDRLGLMARTTSMKKAREAIEPLVPKGKGLEFTLAMHEIADRWNDPDEPIYVSVPELRETAAGKKAYLERQASLKREAERRKKEEARRVAAEKKEVERRKKEEARERKRAEAEAARKTKEAERRRLAEEREKERERKRREVEKAKAAAKKAADRKKAAAAKKKTQVKKKASKKKTAKKKTAKKASKSTGRKAAKKTSSKATKKTSAAKKKTTRKKTVRRR